MKLAQDLEVLQNALSWSEAGFAVGLVTVVQTWGSAPRPPGSLMAIRADGVISGSVSGGCIEEELISRCREQGLPEVPLLLHYGVTPDQAQRVGLPCGGKLAVVVESLTDSAWIETVLRQTQCHQLMQRRLEMSTGLVILKSVTTMQPLSLDEISMTMVFGPKLRLLIIGAGQLSQVLAYMAQPLGYEVMVCDPRDEFSSTWQAALGQHISGMPDEVVVQIQPDSQTAIVALTHDPKLDDMALMEALKSDAFYVGALGSLRTNQQRRERLSLFDLTPEQISRLHGPVGLTIGSRVPAEIAISILAELIKIKNQVKIDC